LSSIRVDVRYYVGERLRRSGGYLVSSRSKAASDDAESLRIIIRPYVSRILSSRPGKRLTEDEAEQLKREPRAVIERVLQATAIRNRGLVGVPFPRLVNSLAGRIPILSTDDVLLELNWTLAVLRHYSKQINEFLALLDEFESSVLSAHYERAHQVRTEVIQRVGHSWWTVESEFLLSQRQGGLEGNRGLLRKFRDKKTSDWVKLLTQYYSARVEDGLSAEDYDQECDLLKTSDDDDLTTQRLRASL
jgi:hypothetical protein